MIKIIRAVVLGVLALAVVAVATPAPAAEAAGVARWNRTTVYVENRLGASWPVRVAAEAWDDSSKLDLVVVTKCPTTSCITVKWGRLPAGTLGTAATAKDGIGRYKRATVTINDRISKSYPYARKLLLVRHEIGHTLGFKHTRKRDVMNEKITASGTPLLGWFHADTLRKVYGR